LVVVMPGKDGPTIQDVTGVLADPARLDALRQASVLDTPPEPSFDRLAALAARLLRAPVALVSLVDTERQFFKSCVGLPEPWNTLRQTPLSHSFCRHVVTSGEPLVVEDARVHAVLKDNLAVRDLGINAYAGIPLRTASGHVLGSFCVTDTQPRRWTDEDLDTLHTLAGSVVTELELRRSASEHRAQCERAERERALSVALLESSRDGIYGLDPEGRCTFINHAAARMLGYEPAELVGRDLRHVLGLKADGAEVGAEALACGDGEVRRRDGTAVTVAYTAAPLTCDGRVAGAVVTFSDVTQRRQAERALRETNALLSAVIDGTSDAVFVKDAAGRYVMLNRAGAAIVGRAMDQVLGRDDRDLFDAATAERIMAADRQIMATGVSSTIEHDYAPLGGPPITLQTSKGPYRDGAGNVVGVLGIARDVTRRKRAEDSLKEAKEQAEAASRAKDKFMAVLSHELRSPLAPVLALASAWERDATVPAELRDDLAVIRRNVELEVRLIDDLLDMTRIARGKLRLAAEPVDAQALLRHAARTCPADELARKRLELTTDLRASRPFVHADAARFHQVLWNLLNNAIKFTPDGGRITVRTWDASPAALAVEVADTGIGIERDLLPRIFDAFEQGADEVTHRFGGLGLGLAICKALVTAMGGEIGAASDGPGKGATFRVLLPTCEPPDTGHKPQAGGTAAAGRPGAPRRPLRILLVEDHVDTSRAMIRLLGRIGHQVRTAGTIRAAVDAARAGPVDVVISDVGLPDGSGHDLMRMLRDLGPVRGIALSGYGTDDDVRKSHDAGFDTHLTKPTDFQRLLDTIDRLAT
jgi:two-component system CheB/CheR fusion protein